MPKTGTEVLTGYAKRIYLFSQGRTLGGDNLEAGRSLWEANMRSDRGPGQGKMVGLEEHAEAAGLREGV